MHGYVSRLARPTLAGHGARARRRTACLCAVAMGDLLLVETPRR
jgi:hypothetical protein